MTFPVGVMSRKLSQALMVRVARMTIKIDFIFIVSPFFMNVGVVALYG
jgi:hypothetical protein